MCSSDLAQLNALTEIDYEKVNASKWEYLKAIYAEKGKQTLKSDGFKEFFDANKSWLVPYAAFCYLRDLYKTPSFKWWKEYS